MVQSVTLGFMQSAIVTQRIYIYIYPKHKKTHTWKRNRRKSKLEVQQKTQEKIQFLLMTCFSSSSGERSRLSAYTLFFLLAATKKEL